MSETVRCIDPEKGKLSFSYEAGWLTPEQAAEFERDHLAQCDYCVEGIAVMTTFIEMGRRHPEILEECQTQRQTYTWRMIIPRSAMAAAAALLVMLTGGLFSYRYYTLYKAKDPYDATAGFAQGPSDTEVLRGGGSAHTLVEQGMRALADKNYLYAAGKFREALVQDPNNPTLAYHLGLTYSLMENYKEAIPALEASQRQATGSVKVDNQWCLANAYLKANRPADAKKVLAVLAASSHRRQAEAQAMLRELNDAK